MFNRLSLTLKMAVVTIAVSVLVSAGMGYYSIVRLSAALDMQLQRQLDRRAVSDRVKFDKYVIGFHQSAVLLSKQNSLVNYLKGDNWKNNKTILTHEEIPVWLPGAAELRLIAGFTYAVLFDALYNPREVYTESSEPAPSALIVKGQALNHMSRGQSFMTMIDNVPYIIASEAVKDDTGTQLAMIMIAHPLDDQFLLSIENSEDNIIALIMGKEPVILASNDPDRLPSGTPVSSLMGKYVFTGKSFLDYGEIEIKVMFASLISTADLARLRSKIITTQLKTEAVEVAVLILSFSLIMFMITRRIERVSRQIAHFSKEQLGIVQEDGIVGDQLIVMERRYKLLADEITTSRDRLIRKSEELFISEQRTRAIVENVPTGIITTDINAEIISINPAAEAIFGYSFEELNGRSFFDLTLDNPSKVFRALALTKELLMQEIRGRRKDGTLFPLETMMSAIDQGEDRIIIIMVIDITKRKEYEEAIRLANEELEEKVKKRTAELSKTNEQLSEEISERKRAEQINQHHLDIQRTISAALDIALEPISLDSQLERIIVLVLSIKWLSVESKGCIFLYNEDTGRLDMKAQLGLSEKILDLCSHVDLGRCICGKAAKRQEIIFTDELDAEHDVMYPDISNHGHYCVPIVSGGDKMLGVINLYVREGHVKEEIEIEFLQAMADTLAGIIERNLTEEKLRMSEELFKSFMKNSPLAAFMKDETGRYVYVNDNFREISHLDPKEVIGKTDRDIFPMTLASTLGDHDAVVLSINKTVDMTETFPHEDGLHQWVIIRFPVKDPSGKRFIAGECIDTTAHKRVEEALKKTEEKYHNIINSTSEGFIELNRSYEIISANDAMLKMLKTTRGKIIGRNLRSAVVGEESESFGRALDTLWDGMGVAANVTLLASDGTALHTRINATPELTDGLRISRAFALITDITELVKVKNSISKYSDELKRSNQELQDFASVASHDLQEPLRKIIAFGDRLRAKTEGMLAEDAADYLQRMQGAASRMQRLIEELLSFSRITTRAKPFVPTDLNAIMQGIVSDLEERIMRTKGRVEFDSLPIVAADPMQMHQLFMNLTANGLKFHAAGVVPVVAVRLINQTEDYYDIAVSDNGIGFDMKYIDRIFKPFQRLHGRGEYEGTGMGLAICDKIVKRHGGLLTVESAPGMGTTFMIRLPAKREPEKVETTE
ncbi:MAG: PAS domain S-box protein [Candidatus Magnetominusculus sp. LBB02]|nr:PAS domain S-box protein [Candidatus Magnetominusculus sp. LBB02]